MAGQHFDLPGAEGEAGVGVFIWGQQQAKAERPMASACELMCQPSASTAIELNHQPATISTSMVATVIHSTRRVPRSAAALPVPYWCWCAQREMSCVSGSLLPRNRKFDQHLGHFRGRQQHRFAQLAGAPVLFAQFFQFDGQASASSRSRPATSRPWLASRQALRSGMASRAASDSACEPKRA